MNFDFKAYQAEAAKTAIYTDSLYPFASLLSEAVELADLYVKRDLRGDKKTISRDEIISESGDVLWNLAAICEDNKIEIEDNFSEVINNFETAEDDHVYLTKDLLVDACHTLKTLHNGHASKLTMRIRAVMVLVRLGELLKTEGIHLAEVAEYNLAKLRSRQERGVLTGSGGNR